LSTSRLCVTLPKSQAEASFARLEAGFEEEAYPLALSEIDEARALYEIALYLPENAAPENATRDALVERFCQIGGFAPQDIRSEILPDIDWVRHALDGLSPVRVRRFFVHGAHDGDKVRPHDLAIEMEAGQAFGTGHHGTTCGCLELIERVMRLKRLHQILDLGTGSGILAIASAKRQAVQVLASDIDPVAVKVARDNMRRNGVHQRVETITAAGLHHRKFCALAPFDLIVANILARPLMQLAPGLRRLVKKGGSLILSGLLDSQRDSVLAAFRNQGLYHHASFHAQGWTSLHLK